MGFNIGTNIASAGKGCFDSVAGIFIGIILFGLAFIPTWCSENVEEVSKIVDETPLTELADAGSVEGLIKIQGEPQDVDYIDDFEAAGCSGISRGQDIFWYEWVLYEYTEHEESYTDNDGDTRTRIVEDWEEQESESDIADFYLEDIEINPADSRVLLVDIQACDDKGDEELGEEWLHIDFKPADYLDTLLVVGEKGGDSISSGHPFIVTISHHPNLWQSSRQMSRPSGSSGPYSASFCFSFRST